LSKSKTYNMKEIILTLGLFFLTNVSYGQRLTYEQTQNIEVSSNYSNGDTLSSYVLKDGSEIVLGSALKFGTPLNGNKYFSRVFFEKYTMTKAVLLGPPIQLEDGYTGENVIVTEIKVYHTKLTKKSPLQIYLYVQNPTAPALARNRTIGDLEMAIETKEVINPNAAMTREQAIAKLKESKDLLDLGIMSQVEFDDLKAKLTPLIIK
jgi:hypothetical protein